MVKDAIQFVSKRLITNQIEVLVIMKDILMLIKALKTEEFIACVTEIVAFYQDDFNGKVGAVIIQLEYFHAFCLNQDDYEAPVPTMKDLKRFLLDGHHVLLHPHLALLALLYLTLPVTSYTYECSFLH